MFNKKKLLILFVVVLIAIFFRFCLLGKVPLGVNVDEVAEGYNAYSLLLTGKDRYGKVFPILFKTFDSYQAPLYTYLTIIPTFLFGLNQFSTRFVSAFSGVLVVVLTFFITKLLLGKENDKGAISLLPHVSCLVVAISPWSIFFSRYATEASVGLVLCLGGLYFLLYSLAKPKFALFGFLLLALSTHAYYTERLLAIFITLLFLILYRKKVFANRRFYVAGGVIFVFILGFHLATIRGGAFSRRLEQVSYFDNTSYQNFGSDFKKYKLGRVYFIGYQFVTHHLSYLSPRNLFFDPDPQGARSIPNLSVFYSVFVVFYLAGLYYIFWGKRDIKNKNLLILLFFISPTVAALTGEPFYTLRVFMFLWVVSVIISLGFVSIYDAAKSFKLRIFFGFIGILVVFFSLFDFYRKYFVLFRYERTNEFGYLDTKLFEILKEYNNEDIIIDFSRRDIATGLRAAYYLRYPPRKFQEETGKKFLNHYYDSDAPVEDNYQFGNIRVKSIDWREDVVPGVFLVADDLAISEKQAKEHNLTKIFEIDEPVGVRKLVGYKKEI